MKGTAPLPPFRLERFFSRHEFAARYLLGASDVEPLALAELLALATPAELERWERLSLGYTESAGDPLLRAEIAELYPHLAADDVLLFAGAEEAIYIALHTLCGPGNHVIGYLPAYQSLHEIARAAGAEVELLRLREDQAWALDLDELRRALRPSTTLLVINFPHNPTGALPPREQFRELLEIAAEAGVRVFSDEAYRFLEHQGSERLPAAADADPLAVTLGVMSKSFALAGLRIGWLASRDRELLARCATFKDYTTICCSAPSEVLAWIALRHRQEVLARSRAICDTNLDLLESFLNRQNEHFGCVPPRGGTICFPRLRNEAVSAGEFATRLLEETGTLLLPGNLMGGSAQHFRIGYGRSNFPDALHQLESFSEQLLR